MLLFLLLSILQVRPGGGMTPQPPDDGSGSGGALGGTLCCFGCGFLYILIPLLMIIGMWKVFAKAGQPGWASLIPIYNVYVVCEIAGTPDNFIFLLIPVLNIYYLFITYIEFCKKFGKETGFAIGLVLLAPVFWCILGFGSAQYRSGRRKKKKRRDDYDDDEDDEDDRPRSKRRSYDEDDEDEPRPSKRGRPRDDDDDDGIQDEPRPSKRKRPRDDDDD
jgi:hypothetical protein